MPLHLRGTFSPNPRVAPLLDGTIQPTGIEIDWETGLPGDLHERHLRDGAHDVFEFSISNYIVTRERTRDRWDWMMIPVYTSKATLGLNTWVNVDSGVDDAADLGGTRFGIPDYTMTAGLWFRAQLDALWGIGAGDIEWFISRQGDQSHARQLGFETEPPRGVTLRWPGPGEVNLMLQSGQLDAAFPAADVGLDTSTGRLRRLFPDGGRRFMASFLERVGYLPANHVVLIRRALVEEHPWAAESIFDAFCRAKSVAYRTNPSAPGILREGNDDMDWQRSAFGDDPFPYGLAANRDMLGAATRQSFRDGLTVDQRDLAQFVPESLAET